MIDDVLVFGETQEEHDQRLKSALERIRKAGATLNIDKCEFSRSSVRFLGQIVDGSGIRADPEKVKAIRAMSEPTSVTEVRRFLGMTNQLSKFCPNLAEKAKPLRDLLSKKNQWSWEDPQKQAFSELKEELSSSRVLALYDPERETVVSADASSYGLGAVLVQKQPEGGWRPVAYASRALTDTEQRYTQIEKEALATTWACERFSDYLLGMGFHIETDHKPLVPLLGSKNLEELPVRVQRFRMRLMRFTYTISHVPGKNLTIADTLSRAPTSSSTTADDKLDSEVQAFVNLVMESLPATEKRLQQIREAQQQDEVCQKVKQYCREGWPDRSLVKGAVKSFLPVSAELTVQNGLLMRGSRIVIPLSMRLDILDKLHAGHQGITKCRKRARSSVWWPDLSGQLEDLVHKCSKCAETRFQYAEPHIPSTFPGRPWQKVASDLFDFKGSVYLLIVDYFSRFIEIAKLSGETSNETIRHMKSIFARHGIPEEVVTDNGPQYSSSLFRELADEYTFLHTTSSPKYSQSNGEAERAVKTVKALLKKTDDPYQALLSYRSTPLHNGYSPAELLMNRRLRTTLPMVPEMLLPSIPDYKSLKEKEHLMKKKQKVNFDAHHAARSLDPLLPGETVWIADHKTSGTVVRQSESAPRSYSVSTPTGTLRRNRRHLTRMSQDTNESLQTDPNSPTNAQPDLPTGTQSDVSTTIPPTPLTSTAGVIRIGRISKPPDRLDIRWN